MRNVSKLMLAAVAVTLLSATQAPLASATCACSKRTTTHTNAHTKKVYREEREVRYAEPRRVHQEEVYYYEEPVYYQQQSGLFGLGILGIL